MGGGGGGGPLLSLLGVQVVGAAALLETVDSTGLRLVILSQLYFCGSRWKEALLLCLHVVIRESAVILQVFAHKNQTLLVRGMSLSWILALTFSMMSLGSTSRTVALPVRVFTKVCICALETLPGCLIEEEDG